MAKITLPPPRRLALPTLNLAYREWGAGCEPLLLLHGLGDSSAVWAGLAAALGDRYRIVAPDLRGHGDSDKPDDPAAYSFAAIAADLEALLAALGWERVTAVGHSWAGKLLLLWARQTPILFERLVLLDPFFSGRLPDWTRVTFPFFYRVLPFLQLLGPFPSQAAAEAKARSLKQYRAWTPLQQQACRANLAAKPDGTWGSKLAIAARDGGFLASVQTAALTAPLDLPALLVRPERGLNRMDWQLAAYRRYLTQLQECVVPGNHWAMLVAPEPLAAALRAWDLETTSQ